MMLRRYSISILRLLNGLKFEVFCHITEGLLCCIVIVIIYCMVERLGISKKKQKKFFKTIKTISGLKWSELSILCDVSERTLRDWARAKYTPLYEICNFLGAEFNIDLPSGFRVLNPYWYIKKYARKGALMRQARYGLLGDKETRRKGGLVSQQRRRENPEKYRLLDCNVRKVLKEPLKPSPQLAELFGIILGDGGITKNQIRITLNRKTDRDYAGFVRKLMNKVFKEMPSISKRENVLSLTLSGIGLVEELERLGLRVGSKIVHQVAIPSWILENREYSKRCLRGLIDTDGGVYFHKHKIKGIKYVNFGLTFTNHSKPLIYGANKILNDNDFYPSIVQNKRIYIYNLSEIKRYFKIIKSNNQKHIKRLNFYLNNYKK